MRIKALVWSVAVALVQGHAGAQIATDGSAGARATLTGPHYGIADTLGYRAGPNLLHSFSTFNVHSGESATFLGPSGIENVIARITGGAPSTIDGVVRVSISGANLFLVNPSGLVFGPGGAVDVSGSFYAATAHTLKLSDGTVVEMRSASPVTLTSAAPSAFGFESAGAALSLSGTTLRVGDNQRIALVAGDIAIGASAGGALSSLVAPSGAIGAVATRGTGNVSIEGERLVPSGFGAMGTLAITGNTSLLANESTAPGGGTIVLRGGDVTLDHASVEARSRTGNGEAIDIAATGRLAIDASNIVAVTTGAGNAGSIRLEARDIAIAGSSLVDTSCDPGCTTGRGGALTIVAANNLSIGNSDASVPTFVVSNSFGGGPTGAISITTGGTLSMNGAAYIQGIALAGGDGSTITLRTGAIDVTDGAQVDASTRGSGRGGNIVVTNAGGMRLSGTRSDPTQNNIRLPSGFFVNAGGSGAAGSIVVSTASLQVLDGAEISSTAQRGSTGDGGRIAVHASGLLRVAGADSEGMSSGIVANAFASGSAGEIELQADRIEIADSGRVQTQSESSGNANTITIRSRELALTGQGQISSDARAGGDGGRLDIAVTETLTIRDANSGIFAKTYGPARGGEILVKAGTIDIAQGGIFAGTDGTGPGGNVQVSAGGALTIADGGRIAANAQASGVAGNVTVGAGDALALSTGGGITTDARSADGGNIDLTVGRLARLDGGLVTTAVGNGQGGGGNIAFRVPTLVLRAATLSANAFGGPGGNIQIGTQTLFKSADSAITASSRLGVDGTITLDSPALDPTGELLAPAPVFLDAGAILAGRCGPRLAGRTSSLLFEPQGFAGFFPDELRPALDPVSPALSRLLSTGAPQCEARAQ